MKTIDEVVMVDCAMQVKKFYNLYLDADFDDKLDLALFYKYKMEHFQSLVDQGVEHEPNF